MTGIIEPHQLVDMEVFIYVKEADGGWYVEEDYDAIFRECTYMMIGTDINTWTFAPNMLHRQFWLKNALYGMLYTVVKSNRADIGMPEVEEFHIVEAHTVGEHRTHINRDPQAYGYI
jgi:hypothetical protein